MEYMKFLALGRVLPEAPGVAYDHWSVAVLTVTVHSSFFPLLIFFKICCFLHWIQSVNPHFLLPYIIMDLPIFHHCMQSVDPTRVSHDQSKSL